MPEDQERDDQDNIVPPSVSNPVVIPGPRKGMIDLDLWLARLTEQGTLYTLFSFRPSPPDASLSSD
jgi:hypothetical protein